MNRIYKILFILILLQTEGFSQQFVLKWTNPVNAVSLNSKYNDFGAEFNRFDSLLYFCSDRKSNKSHFYISKISDSINFSMPELVKGEINEGNDNVSYISFLLEDKSYISSFRMNGRPYFNIFETIKTRDGWSAQIPVPEFSKDYNILQPAFSPDGKMLAFISDMKSDDKKTDIFISYKNELGNWSQPEFMSILNTDEMEITPRFHTNDTLFFASDGMSGPGGFDIFYTTRKIDGSWSKPNPLNEINTPFDESDLVILPNNFAIFASNRPGGKGGIDLFLTSYYWSENKIAPERLLDISISTQIVNIKTLSEFSYELVSLPNAILSDINKDTINIMLSKKDTSFEFTGNIDSDYPALINELGFRISESKNSRLFIHYNILESDDKTIKLPNSVSIAEVVRDYFVNVWDLDTKNIELIKHVIKITGSELQSFPLLYFDSDNPRIFSPNQTGQRTVSVDPPFSDIFIKIKPAEIYHSSMINMQIGKKINVFTKYSENSTEQFTVPLNDFAAELVRTDSLKITVSAVNKLNDTISKSLQFDITHSETKKRKRVTIDDKQYEQILVFIPELDGETVPGYLKEVIDQISESVAFTKSFKIQFYSLLAQKKAVNFYNILKKKLNLQNLKMDIEQVSYVNDSKFSRRFIPYLIRVLLEKP